MSGWLVLNPAVEQQLTPTLRMLVYRATAGTNTTIYGLGHLMLGWGVASDLAKKCGYKP